MKAVKSKWPKAIWVLKWSSGSFSAYTDHKTAGNGSKRYHLHPGNEVKLKRENTRYLRWLKVLVNPMSIATRIIIWTEIRRVMPDLFKAKRRGSK